MIYYACRNTWLGLMLMAVTDKGVCSLQFGDDEGQLLAQLKAEYPNAELSVSASQHVAKLDIWMKALNQYISQEAPRPDLPLDISGTAFQIKVWRFLLTIQEGESVSYAEVAEQIGAPNAARAVGSACAKNRISVLIPCHRVLKSDGGLGGYRWGLERKQALLDKESK